MSTSATTAELAAIADAVEALLDVARIRHTEAKDDGETFTECRMCGEWEGHANDCAVPLLEKWLNS
jgi:hypothetical protein